MKPILKPNVIHVIDATDANGACSRMLKVLMAILNGRWILKPDCKFPCLLSCPFTIVDVDSIIGAYKTSPFVHTLVISRSLSDCSLRINLRTLLE